MKINIFGLSKEREVKRILHQIWCFQQKPPYLPIWCDFDFQRCYRYVKNKYGLKALEKKFDL